jgi:hypothetical protein
MAADPHIPPSSPAKAGEPVFQSADDGLDGCGALDTVNNGAAHCALFTLGLRSIGGTLPYSAGVLAGGGGGDAAGGLAAAAALAAFFSTMTTAMIEPS